MSRRSTSRLFTAGGLFQWSVLAAIALTLCATSPTYAGHLIGRNRSVGGVNIDAEGFLGPAEVKATEMFRRDMLRGTKAADGEMTGKTEIRKISLKRLEAGLEDAIKNNAGQIPSEMMYLAGLQRIEYVLLYPEEGDIVLAGPGEGWKIDERGNVVGQTTGRPVVQLDDLVVALRSVDEARTEGISCSIDPTEEGLEKMQALMRKLEVFSPQVPDLIEQAMGPQKITLTGVPESSHFARVMVAADYRMKRYAMKLEPAPVRELTSFVDIARPAGNMMPRWWLSCNYDALARSEDGLAWQIRGAGVKAETEDPDGKKDPVAQKWADLMTANYDALAVKDPVFGDLRNLMDMCVIAALISKEGLLEKAGCSLPLLTADDSMLMIESWNPPKQVATQAGATKKGRNWVITASGGVLVDSWRVASESKVDARAGQVHEAAARPADRKQWWWN